MDGILIFLVIVGWVVSAVSKAQKKQKQARQTADPQDQRPLRPADVDLPGQTRSMPIHWDGTTGSEGSLSPTSPARTIPEPDDALRVFYSGEGDPNWKPRPEHIASESFEDIKPVVEIPGLDLHFDGDSLVKGVIYSEILTRPTHRRTR